jgi:hypothetical protein
MHSEWRAIDYAHELLRAGFVVYAMQADGKTWTEEQMLDLCGPPQSK